MSAGTDEFPYRPACDGQYHAPRRAVGSCYQHKRANERGIPMMINVTEAEVSGDCVKNFADGTARGGCGAPTEPNQNFFAAPVLPSGVTTDTTGYAAGATAVTIASAGSGYIVTGQSFTFAGDATVYTATVSIADVSAGGSLTFTPELAADLAAEAVAITFTATMDFSLCHKVGWKAVRAQKSWHGMYSFTSTDRLQDCTPPTDDVDTVKYLSIARTVSAGLSQEGVDGLGNPITYTYTLLQTATTSIPDVNRGIVVLSGWAYDWTPENGGTSPDPTGGAFASASASCGLFRAEDVADSLNMDVAVDPSAGPGFNGNPSYNFEPYGLAGWILTSKSITATSATFTIASPTDQGTYSTAWQGSLTFTATLATQYTYQEVEDAVYELLNEWDLGDDAVYPWRLDTTCSVVPMVVLEETSPKSPDVGWPDSAGWTDSDDTDLSDGFPKYSGDVVGAPLPAGYTSGGPNGNGAFYAFRMPYLGVTGKWSPSFHGAGGTTGVIPDTARWWNLDTTLPDGAFYQFNNGVLLVQKWAVVKDSRPSIDFFRPCGADRDTAGFEDAWPICGRCAVSDKHDNGDGTVTVTLSDETPYLRTGDAVDFVSYDSSYAETVLVADQNRAVTVTDSTHFDVSGTVPTGNYVKSYVASRTPSDAPHFKWHNDTAKGDYVLLSWVTDVPTAVTEYTCTQGCILRTPCAPSVVCVSPGGDNFDNAVVHWEESGDPGTSWQMIAMTDINDPFGSGFRTEARCAVPDGAPELHASAAKLPCPTETGDCGAPSYVCFQSEEWV